MSVQFSSTRNATTVIPFVWWFCGAPDTRHDKASSIASDRGCRSVRKELRRTNSLHCRSALNSLPNCLSWNRPTLASQQLYLDVCDHFNSLISHSVPVCLLLCHLCSALEANKVLYIGFTVVANTVFATTVKLKRLCLQSCNSLMLRRTYTSVSLVLRK